MANNTDHTLTKESFRLGCFDLCKQAGLVSRSYTVTVRKSEKMLATRGPQPVLKMNSESENVELKLLVSSLISSGTDALLKSHFRFVECLVCRNAAFGEHAVTCVNLCP